MADDLRHSTAKVAFSAATGSQHVRPGATVGIECVLKYHVICAPFSILHSL